MEAQLIIRAPNQNIEDQVIKCNMDWTILKLKIHLSEVYPNRPFVQDQKLIYSGRLLNDHLLLKDIIRQEDMDSNTQILHLVCSGAYSPSFLEQSTASTQNWSNESTPVMQSSSFSEDNHETSSDNILRHRPNPVTPQVNNIQPQFPQMPVSPVFPNDPQMLAHMAAMQQMYAQYMSQYWQSLNMVGSSENAVPVVSSTHSQPNNSSGVTQEAAAQQPGNQRVNIQAAIPVEEEFNRDWLDHVFLYLRFLILLGIVYFYSTPERFMLVIIIVVIAFLYNEGWFMRHGFAEAVIGQRNRAQAEPNPNAGNNINERLLPNENEENDGHELEAAMDGEDPPHAQNPDVANNNHVFSPLTFLATFFSSLIPEPPPPVNIN